MLRNLLKVSVLLVAATLIGAASADRHNDDVYLHVENEQLERAAKDLGVGRTGRELHRTQESLHRSVRKTTGVAVPHNYIWFCVGDSQCLPVDPYTADN
jgi:hypothetical protein